VKGTSSILAGKSMGPSIERSFSTSPLLSNNRILDRRYRALAALCRTTCFDLTEEEWHS
jgi:hypothetical protein